MNLYSIFVIALVGFAITMVVRGIVIVGQGWEYTVERFGRFTKRLPPGLHLIVPFVDRIGYRINMMEQLIDVPSQKVITKDNAMIRVNGILFFQVVESPLAAYEVLDYVDAVSKLVMTNIRNVMGSMDLQEMLSNRDNITNDLMQVVDEATRPWGIKVTRIEIQDIEPPEHLSDAMARQITAERDKRAAILEAEGDREAAMKRAEGEREAVIRAAEGQKQQQVLDAQARREAAELDAQSRERLAQAEARATHLISKAISQGDIQALNYFVAQRYTDALGKMASAENGKVIFMPLEASNIIGALGGISELFKAQKDSSQMPDNTAPPTHPMPPWTPNSGQ